MGVAKASLIAVPTSALCEMVWVLLLGYRDTPAQVAHALRTLLQVRQVVCHTPAVLAGLAQLAIQLLKAQKLKVRLLVV